LYLEVSTSLSYAPYPLKPLKAWDDLSVRNGRGVDTGKEEKLNKEEGGGIGRMTDKVEMGKVSLWMTPSCEM
jgi:hypothetical protein